MQERAGRENLEKAAGDESETEELRNRIACLEKQLQETQRASRQYLQNVAHQLTAPLGAIKWSIEALRDPSIPLHKKDNLLRSIYSQATILVHLIKNFALMSNLEVDHELGEFREKPEKVDLLRLAINLANDFQPQASDGGKKIEVNSRSFSIVKGKYSAMVVKNLVAQALSNLLENAVKYADLRSTIHVTAERLKLRDTSETVWIGLSVASVGMPIGRGDCDRVFNRGFRGTTARQKVPAGTGIGGVKWFGVFELALVTGFPGRGVFGNWWGAVGRNTFLLMREA